LALKRGCQLTGGPFSFGSMANHFLEKKPTP
jgi:hypothetical protein